MVARSNGTSCTLAVSIRHWHEECRRSWLYSATHLVALLLVLKRPTFATDIVLVRRSLHTTALPCMNIAPKVKSEASGEGFFFFFFNRYMLPAGPDVITWHHVRCPSVRRKRRQREITLGSQRSTLSRNSLTIFSLQFSINKAGSWRQLAPFPTPATCFVHLPQLSIRVIIPCPE